MPMGPYTMNRYRLANDYPVELARAVTNVLPEGRPVMVGDLGCGSENRTQRLLREGDRFIGVDMHGAAIDQLRPKVKNGLTWGNVYKVHLGE